MLKTKFLIPILVMGIYNIGCNSASNSSVEIKDEFLKWQLNSLTTIDEHNVTVLGEPDVVTADGLNAIAFDGSSDGLIVSMNPVAGMNQFTIEVLFKPDFDGLPEQRFIHFQDSLENRGLIETRVNPDSTWTLDTFLYNKDPDSRLTLLDRNITHPTDKWYWVALWYDGTTMKHYVNGVEELSGEVAFNPMTEGQISIGVRLNQVHWFKGLISELRFHDKALQENELQTSCNCDPTTYVINHSKLRNQL